jgi:small subunit ribosomal protein S17
MAKTRVVEIPRLVQHPRYGKYVRRKTVCYVHDETEQAAQGDTVEIIESRPLSRTKRWELVRVVEKGRGQAAVSLPEMSPESETK